MKLNNKFVENLWTGMCIVNYFVFAFLLALLCSCSATPKGVVIKDIKYHMTFNRAAMHGDTLVSIARYKSVQQGVEVDSVINEQTIGALVLFHNMRLIKD